MQNTSKELTQNAQDNPGLIVPIDLEALCIGLNPGSIFEPNPFNFSFLSKGGAYLSSSAAAGGLNRMDAGVHLHWALPDVLTQGQNTGSGTLWPAVPDRWLVTRIFCDPDQAAKPAFASWVIESNYYAGDNLTEAQGRTAITIPYSGDNWQQQPWRQLGRVSTVQDWLKEKSTIEASPAESYLKSLSAVGYGQPDFASSYQNCQNVLGFNDLGSDLEKLGTSGHDKYLSYHVIGWYSIPANDPIQQLPAALPVAQYNTLLAAITNAGDKTFFTANYPVGKYALVKNVSPDAGKKLWKILEAAGYPLQINIPLEITPADFEAVLAKTDPAGQTILKDNYLAVMVLTPNLAAADVSRMYSILSTAGFDFLGQVMQKAKWSVPSGTVIPAVAPTYTLYSGMITNIVWNANTDYFKNDPGNNFNIAIGNTAEEALSALIANTSGFAPDKVAEVEEILNALQTGILSKVTDENMLADWEELQATLHKNSFASNKSGFIWEITQSNTDPQADGGEVTLPENLAKMLNDINSVEQQYDELNDRITSVKTQLFADWYRFMQTQYGTNPDPAYLNNLASYMEQKISVLDDLKNKADQAVTDITTRRDAIEHQLGNTYFLSKVTAPRHWQPTNPVVLFQGKGIDPAKRFGNDGRDMYNDTLLCRLSGQLVTSLTVAAGAIGSNPAITLTAADFSFPGAGAQVGLGVTLLDVALQNPAVIATELRAAGDTQPLVALAGQVMPVVNTFIEPDVPKQVTADVFNSIINVIYTADASFLKSVYTAAGDVYNLNPDPTDKDILRIKYILNSVSYNPSAAQLQYAGLPFSEVGINTWTENPWLPFSLKWSVYYYPLNLLQVGGNGYDPNFITSNFVFGNTDLVYNGPTVTPASTGLAIYKNTIFLTPHANINLQKQLATFIDQHPDDSIKDVLNDILKKLNDKPVLSQSLSGFNDALIMQHQVMQLPVADPLDGAFYSFTNTDVHNAVLDQRTQMPDVTYSYNPIRTGLMKIDSVTLVDVFGRNVSINQPSKIYTPFSMQQSTQPPHVMLPTTNIYLPPRITQQARLLFRWLSADDDTVEMNTHPATSPICGWALTNLLDNSLWIYDSYGNAYGSLILKAGLTGILWQPAPGSPYFGFTIQQFFNAMPGVNPHLKDFVLGLYGNGDKDAATYLNAFMRALDKASVTIEPANYKQYQSNAALMGSPMALVRASLNLELEGEPAYSQSTPDLQAEVNAFANKGQYIPGIEYNFTKVNFPVKIGNIHQTEDGLLGYFKNNDYSTFYTPAVDHAADGVIPPAVDNLVVNCTADTPAVVVSMLIEPRGKIHATTGILPVKSIEIPPDQYTDAMQKLQLCFLTSPVLTPQAQLAMPLPAQSGGSWVWVENDGDSWSQKQQIAAVSPDATLNYKPQQLLEGWLSLASMILGGSCFDIVNVKAKAPVLYITNDASQNALTFTLTNKTGVALKLAGGPPAGRPYQPGGSSFIFNFGSILPDDVLAKLTVSAAGWTAAYYKADEYAAAVWAIAPDAEMTLDVNKSVSFSITGITCGPGTLPGNFQVSYVNLPDVANSMAPVRLPISVLQPNS